MIEPCSDQRERGFAMLELIIVCCVAGVLMAIFVPSLLSQKKAAPNAAVVMAAQTFEAAMSEYQRSFPPVGGPDPLVTRGGYTGPFTSALPPTRGLYGAAGDPLIKNWPVDPFTKQPIVVNRGGCSMTGVAGSIRVCRPVVGGAPNLAAVRVLAWGRSKAGSAVLVYDSETCGGRCKLVT